MRRTLHRNRLLRRHRGVGCVEIALATMFMVALSAMGTDMTLVAFAVTLNDAACRDAARAAAQQSNLAQAVQAAQAQVQVHYIGSNWISKPSLTSTASPYFVYNDYSGVPPTNTSPYVTVTTGTTIKCPVPIPFFGAGLAPGTTIQASRTYTFPIVKEKFYSGN